MALARAPFQERYMSTNRLGPNSTATLSSLLRYQNYTQKFDVLSINETNFSADSAPLVSTFGDGKMELSGQLVVAGTPTTFYEIGTFPSYIIPLRDVVLPVCVLRAGAPVLNAIKINASGDSVASITVTAPGSYATLPVVSISAPGAGAVLSLHMQAVSATIAAAGTGYAPSNTIVLTGSTGTNPTLNVVTTKVVSATIAAAGTGGTDGTQTVTGTTGTGTKFQASVTIAGNEITAVLSITLGGSYTANPTDIGNEPVTGGGLTGAALNVVMGVATVSVSAGSPGDCTVLASSPVAQGSTSGSGTGATFTVLWGARSVAVSVQGSGYTSASQVAFTGGGGTGGAAATLTLDATVNVQLVATPNVGDIVSLDGVDFMARPYY